MDGGAPSNGGQKPAYKIKRKTIGHPCEDVLLFFINIYGKIHVY